MRIEDYKSAREYALWRAHESRFDIAIRKTKEYNRWGYNISFACVNDSDYAKAEIVKPTDQI